MKFIFGIIIIFLISLNLPAENIIDKFEGNPGQIEKLTPASIKSFNISIQEKIEIIDYLISYYNSKKNFSKEIEFLKSGLDLTDNEKYYFDLISLYKKNNLTKEIQKLVNQYLSNRKGNFLAYKNISKHFVSLGDLDYAIYVLLKGREEFHIPQFFFWELRNLYEANENYDKLIDEYINYLNISFDPFVKNDFIQFIKDKKVEERTISQIISKGNNSKIVNEILTELYLIKNDFDKAVETFLSISSDKNELNGFINTLIINKYFTAVKMLNQKLLLNNLKSKEEVLLDLCKIGIISNDLTNIEDTLSQLNADTLFPLNLKDDLNKVNSDYYYKIKRFDKSLEFLECVSSKTDEDKLKLLKLMIFNDKYYDCKKFIEDKINGFSENFKELNYYKSMVYLLNDNFADFENYLNEYLKQEISNIPLNYFVYKLKYIKTVSVDNYAIIKDFCKLFFLFEKDDFQNIQNYFKKYSDTDNEVRQIFLEAMLDYYAANNNYLIQNDIVSDCLINNDFYQTMAKAVYLILKSDIDKNKKLEYLKLCEIPEFKKTIYYPLIIKEIKDK